MLEQQITNRLYAMMHLKGWSKTKIAKELHVTPTTVGYMFQRPLSFKYEKLAKLVQLLGGRVERNIEVYLPEN